LTPAEYVRRTAAGEDFPSEALLDRALTSWLQAGYSVALDRLASRLIQEHGDTMLRDILYGFAGDASLRAARQLANAIRANTAGDRDMGYRLASDASFLFHAVSNQAGELRAREEVVYALSRSFRSTECLEESSLLLRALGNRYPWMQAQVLLARATCTGRMSDIGSEFVLKRRAIQIAETHRYSVLTLRAIGLMAGARTLVDDLEAAQREDYDGLQRYWNGIYPPLRAYQFYSDLSEIAKKEGHWNMGYETSSEAVPMIQSAGNRATEAMARYRLAMFAGLLGKPVEASAQTRYADQLLAEFGNSSSASTLRAESLIQMAQAYQDQGEFQHAQVVLEAIRDRDIESALLLKLAFYRLRGQVAQHLNQTVRAQQSFETAYRVAESALRTVRSPRDRATWQAEAAPLHRQLVRLVIEEENAPERALAIWEKFRSDSAGLGESGADSVDSIRAFAKSLRRVTVLSLVQFEDYLGGWLIDDRGIYPFRAAVSAVRAKQACEEFLMLASTPGSDILLLRNKAASLFSTILGPVKGMLESGRVLAIEPDGPCSAIPFEALIGDDGAYLAEHFTILTSPGTLALDRWRRSTSPLTSAARMLIAADPHLDDDLASEYPELPDARREGEAVARLFPRATLFTAGSATVDAIRESLGEADIFHFAGHGVGTSGNGVLLLAASEKASGVGYFGSSQVAASGLRCRLAFLSACYSGAGTRLGVFNPDGLVQAFWRAGTQNIVATRWAVDSHVAFEIVTRFYPLVLGGMSPAEALRVSTGDIRRSYPHPAFWAGFEVYGSPFPTNTERRK
jgi:CHAT domain-containing protein